MKHLVCILCLTFVFYQTIAQSAFDKGQRLIQEKKYQEAIIEFDKAIQENPNYSYAYTRKSGCLILLERYSEALIVANKATEIDPTDWRPYYNKASIYRKESMKNTEEVMKNMKMVFLLDKSNSWKPYWLMGDIHFENAEYSKALENWEKVIVIEPNFSKSSLDYYQMAFLYFDAENFDNALKYILLELNKQQSPEVYYLYAQIYYYRPSPNYDEAYKNYKKAIDLNLKEKYKKYAEERIAEIELKKNTVSVSSNNSTTKQSSISLPQKYTFENCIIPYPNDWVHETEFQGDMKIEHLNPRGMFTSGIEMIFINVLGTIDGYKNLYDMVEKEKRELTEKGVSKLQVSKLPVSNQDAYIISYEENSKYKKIEFYGPLIDKQSVKMSYIEIIGASSEYFSIVEQIMKNVTIK